MTCGGFEKKRLVLKKTGWNRGRSQLKSSSITSEGRDRERVWWGRERVMTGEIRNTQYRQRAIFR